MKKIHDNYGDDMKIERNELFGIFRILKIKKDCIRDYKLNRSLIRYY